VLVPSLFWYQTWFGIVLGDEAIIERLEAVRTAGSSDADAAKYRQAMHALEQVSKRIEDWRQSELLAGKRQEPPPPRPATLGPIYDAVLALVVHPQPVLRKSAAWLMGEDIREPRFREALLRLIDDAAPLVRRQAALSLSKFDEPQARRVLREMLESYEVRAPFAGQVVALLGAGRSVPEGGELVRLRREDGSVETIRAPLAGRVEGVATGVDRPVEAGHKLLALGPNALDVYEALRALLLVGRAEDLNLIDAWTRPGAAYGERVATQAAITAKRIRERSK